MTVCGIGLHDLCAGTLNGGKNEKPILYPVGLYLALA
jgi:hypothetical protein